MRRCGDDGLYSSSLAIIMTMGLTKVKKVDEKLLEEVAGRIVEVVGSETMILFGSYAYGEPHEGSDLDILVVMPSELPLYKRSVPIYKALADLLRPMDARKSQSLGRCAGDIDYRFGKGRALYEKSNLDLVREWLEKSEVRSQAEPRRLGFLSQWPCSSHKLSDPITLSSRCLAGKR